MCNNNNNIDFFYIIRKEKAVTLFLNPDTSAQRRYEAVRAYFIENQSPREVAERFGYAYGTVRNLCSDVYKTDKLPFFLPDQRGRPKSASKQPGTSADQEAQAKAVRTQRILELRQQDNLSAAEIAAMLQHEGFATSMSTVSKTLRAAAAQTNHYGCALMLPSRAWLLWPTINCLI